MSKVPNPCIDVCKYRMAGGRCIGCAMTKTDRKRFKALDGKKAKRAFLADLLETQARTGRSFAAWRAAYRRKCAKKGAVCPIDMAGGAG